MEPPKGPVRLETPDEAERRKEERRPPRQRAAAKEVPADKRRASRQERRGDERGADVVPDPCLGGKANRAPSVLRGSCVEGFAEGADRCGVNERQHRLN